MKKHIKALVMHPLISGSTIIFAGSFIVNILNYFFNLVMGRLLSVSDYGLLISLVALVSILTLFQNSLTTLFAKFASKYAVHKDYSSEKSFIKFATKITFTIATSAFLILLILTIPLSQFLHVNNLLLMTLVFLSVFFSILCSLPSGILQGNLKFSLLAGVNVFGSIGKVILGVVLVVGGLGVVGGAVGMLTLFVLPYVLSSLYIYIRSNRQKESSKKIQINLVEEFKKVSGPFLIASFAITILQGSDVIFARHFFNDVVAGQYAALSLMGKAIFYITSPIYFVFFPVIAHKKEKNEETKGTLLLASAIIFVCSLVFTAIYFTFPEIILQIFFPAKAYASLASYLGFYSLYILIFSFCFLLFNYFLSIGKTGIYKINIFVAVLYVALLFVFHKNIADFIVVLIFSSFLLLLLLLVYYWRYESH